MTTDRSRALRLKVGNYRPTGTPHNVVALAQSDLEILGLADHDWIDVISLAATIRARIRSSDAESKAPQGTILLTSRLSRALGLARDDTEVDVVPVRVAQRRVSVGVARVEVVAEWDKAEAVADLAALGSPLVEILNPRTNDTIVLRLLGTRSAHNDAEIGLSALQKRLIRWDKGDEIVVRPSTLPHLAAPSRLSGFHGRVLALGESLVGSRHLPGRVHPADPVDSAAEVAQVAKPLWVALGLQDGDRIVCSANGRLVTRRVASRAVVEVNPEPPDADPQVENATQRDFAVYLDQPARVLLGLDRRERDTVVVFRDPVAALSRSLSAGLISALLTGISVAQAGAILGATTAPAAILLAAAVFYFALSAERSRVH